MMPNPNQAEQTRQKPHVKLKSDEECVPCKIEEARQRLQATKRGGGQGRSERKPGTEEATGVSAQSKGAPSSAAEAEKNPQRMADAALRETKPGCDCGS